MLPKAPCGFCKSRLFCLFLQSHLPITVWRQLVLLCLGLPRRLLEAAFVNRVCQPPPLSEMLTVMPTVLVTHRAPESMSGLRGSWEEPLFFILPGTPGNESLLVSLSFFRVGTNSCFHPYTRQT